MEDESCWSAMADEGEAATLLTESDRRKETYPPLPAKQALYLVEDAQKFELGPLNAGVAPFSPPTKKEATHEERRSFWKRVSGSALCKVTVIVYLLACVLVSALYVALYGGQSQKMFAASDAWIPGKVSFSRRDGKTQLLSTSLALFLCVCVGILSVCVCLCGCAYVGSILKLLCDYSK